MQNWKILVFHISLLLLFISCGQNLNIIGDSEYVIIQYKSDLPIGDITRGKPTGLNRKEIESIEVIIKERVSFIQSINDKQLDNYPKLTSKEREELKKYQRQYVPYIDENNQKLVWINFFCQTYSPDQWRTQIVMVEDGGSCYFSMTVNLMTEEIVDYYINGLATLYPKQ